MGVSPSFETMKPQLCFFLKNPFLFNNIEFKIGMLGPLCYKLITIVNCYLETGLSCIVY